MNITIYENSREWLFANPARSVVERAWSLGRFPKPVKAGDPLYFRWDGKIVARAVCSSVSQPGERNCIMHDGSRELRGFKVQWLPATFEDLREKPEVAAEIEASLKQRKRAKAKSA